MDRQIITNPDCSYTLIEDDRRMDLPAGASREDLDAAQAAFFETLGEA